jgi:hypothetical protein
VPGVRHAVAAGAQRWLSDLAVSGQEVMIELSARRFFCVAAGCGKVTFAEQVPGLTVRYRRRGAAWGLGRQQVRGRLPGSVRAGSAAGGTSAG